MRPICSSLCYIQKGSKTLMLHRRKHVGKIYDDKWNGLGGKMEPGETPEECAVREVREESGLEAKSLKLKGILTFPNFDGVDDWMVFVYVVKKFSGNLMKVSPEGDLEWIPTKDIPKLNLWEGDRYFIKLLTGPKIFSGKFIYKNGQYISHELSFY